MAIKKKSGRVILKANVSAVGEERADVFVEKMICRPDYTIPNTVESVLEFNSLCVVWSSTHNLVFVFVFGT